MPRPIAIRPPVRVRACRDQRDRAAAFAIRRAVFVRGQGVPARLERDAADGDALHLLAVDAGGVALGAARLVDLGRGTAKLGRVAVLARARGRGIGIALVRAACAAARRRGFRRVALHAQVPAVGFYSALGFAAVGPVFVEAGIPHRRMRRAI